MPNLLCLKERGTVSYFNFLKFYGLFLMSELTKVEQNGSNFYEINFYDFSVKQKTLESFQSSGFSEYSGSFEC